MAAIGTPTSHGLVMRFEVVIDGFDLGSWATCKGLEVAFKHEQVKELGEHAYSTFIPGRAEYSKLTLQRAMQPGDWDVTKQWLAKVTHDARLKDRDRNSDKDGARTATITLRDASLQEVATWTLRNAMAAGWKGPQFDANGHTVALEILELVHEGFLDD
jgi:phage tail-like protein